MLIGVPREIKDHEYRVGIVPAGVQALLAGGHQVLVEQAAGLGSEISDEEYRQAGAEIVASAAEVYDRADLVVKVKEPLPSEYPLLRQGLLLYTFLHLAPLPELTRVLLDRRVTGIAYETIRLADGTLPLLAPMSEVAGRMAVQVAARYLEKKEGGRGVLLGGVPGVAPGRVTIIGSGTVGRNAARIAVGLGASVTVLGLMKKGTVLVDVAIDQGGCAETSRPTTHSEPTYVVDGITHYCVANMPGAFPRTSTLALTNATLPLLLKIASLGLEKAAAADPALRQGINTHAGKLTNPEVAASQNRPWEELPW